MLLDIGKAFLNAPRNNIVSRVFTNWNVIFISWIKNGHGCCEYIGHHEKLIQTRLIDAYICILPVVVMFISCQYPVLER